MSKPLGLLGLRPRLSKKSRLLLMLGLSVPVFVRHLYRSIVGSASAFDWLMLGVEVAVLGIIAVELIRSVLHARKVRQWVSALSDRVLAGYALENAVPNTNADTAATDDFNQQVHAWGVETIKILRKYSSKAEMAFILTRPQAGVRYSVAPASHDWFVQLRERTTNLRELMEKPDVYLG